MSSNFALVEGRGAHELAAICAWSWGAIFRRVTSIAIAIAIAVIDIAAIKPTEARCTSTREATLLCGPGCARTWAV